jgi:hypothetical protein
MAYSGSFAVSGTGTSYAPCGISFIIASMFSRHDIGHLALPDLQDPHHHLGLFLDPGLPNRNTKKVLKPSQLLISEGIGIYCHLFAADVFVVNLRVHKVENAVPQPPLLPCTLFDPSTPLAQTCRESELQALDPAVALVL